MAWRPWRAKTACAAASPATTPPGCTSGCPTRSVISIPWPAKPATSRKVYGPALQVLDWTLVDRDGLPRRQYREVEGDPTTADSLIHGFRPAMLARDNVGGKRKLAPFNLVSSWYWLAGDPPRPVSREQLVDALYPNGRLPRGLLRATGPGW